MKIPIQHLINPVSRKALSIKGTDLYDNENIKCAEVFEEDLRIDWISFNQYNELDNRVLREINKYDNWADKQSIRNSSPVVINDFNINIQKIYSDNANFKEIDINLGELVKNKIAIDIGGSCIDTWRLLAAGAKEIHHIEVSKNSQKFGLERIKSKLGKEFDLNNKLFFHTSPSEYLPFQNGYFDFVFSRSSIHHTVRDLSLKEIHRVLKKGGSFLFFEPLQNGLINKLMHISRKIRRVDRGTDNPLTKQDINLLNELFNEVVYSPKKFLINDLGVIKSWILKSNRNKPKVPVLYGKK